MVVTRRARWCVQASREMAVKCRARWCKCSRSSSFYLHTFCGQAARSDWFLQLQRPSPRCGSAKHCQRPAGQASLPTAGLSLWHIHPDFLPLHLSNANGLQVLLFALEEESAIKPVYSDDWVQMAKSNGIQVCHHVIDAPRGCWPNWNARGENHRRCTGWCWCCLLHRQQLVLLVLVLRHGNRWK